MKEQLEAMKASLISCAQSHINDENVDAKELGEVFDMIKDIEEALYYCTITKAMEEGKEKDKNSETTVKMDENLSELRTNRQNYYTPTVNNGQNYYTRYLDPRYDYRDQMYYGGPYQNTNMTKVPSMVHDYREGRSPMYRKGYMESKENHSDPALQREELDKYVQELGHDITEMVAQATPEEKQILKKKLMELHEKI